MRPFRIVDSRYSVKNGLSSVGVSRYTSLVCALFSSNTANLWIAIGFEMSSSDLREIITKIEMIASELKSLQLNERQRQVTQEVDNFLLRFKIYVSAG